MSPCQRCGQTDSGPKAFLLTCRGCGKTWHHRCHQPPVEDQDLIQLIRATTSGDTANDLSTWMCRRCKKRTLETPSAVSSREQTVSSESREDSKSRSSTTITDDATTTKAASTTDVRVKQESGAPVEVRLANDRGRDNSGPQESTEAPLARRNMSAKRAKPSTATQPRDAAAAPIKPTPQETKSKSPPRCSSPTQSESHPFKAARKFAGTVSGISSEDDVRMQIDSPISSKSTSHTTLRASQVPSSIRPRSDPVLEGPSKVHTASPASDRGWEVRPAVGVAIQPQVNRVAADEVDDDPEDLYGPPVERRIIRILPSLAEELREQQRRVAAEKEKRRAPLAPDWILARHINDPSWKEVPKEGQKRRKPTARKLGDNDLNVSELMGYHTVQDWVREHKT